MFSIAFDVAVVVFGSYCDLHARFYDFMYIWNPHVREIPMYKGNTGEHMFHLRGRAMTSLAGKAWKSN